MSERDNSTNRLPYRGLRNLLARRIVWVTDSRRELTGEISDVPALVAIVGREHYTERRRQYPIVSRRDLGAVLRQELAGAPPTMTTISGVHDERREVTFFELRPGARNAIGRTLLVVPESVLLAATLSSDAVALVERSDFRYFVAGNGISQPVGGPVATAELFALAAGIEVGSSTVLSGNQLQERLLGGLRRVPLDTWLRLRVPTERLRPPVEWRPIAAITSAALIGYLALASGYLAFTETTRERQLQGLGPEVETLLDAQRDVDAMLAEQAGLSDLMSERRSSYRIWQVAAVAWAQGAELSAIELREDSLVLRGSAPVATEVLAAVAGLPGMADAAFSAPVRTGRKGREEFSIGLRLVSEINRG